MAKKFNPVMFSWAFGGFRYVKKPNTNTWHEDRTQNYRILERSTDHANYRVDYNSATLLDDTIIEVVRAKVYYNGGLCETIYTGRSIEVAKRKIREHAKMILIEQNNLDRTK